MTRLLSTLVVSLALWSSTAGAEPACRRVGEDVVCTKDGFEKLVKLTVSLQADVKKAGEVSAKAFVDLGACEVGLKAALDRPVVIDSGSPDIAVLTAVGAGGLLIGLLVGSFVVASVR